MQQRIDPIAYDSTLFLSDIREAALQIDAPFDEAITRRALELFDPEFQSCVVQLKAVCKPGTGVYYRFFYKGELDLTQRAIEAGMLHSTNQLNIDLQAEVLAAFPRATRAGLDFDSGFGLAKVWTFTGGTTTVEELLSLHNIPQSVRDHAGFFARHGLSRIGFVASDYQSETMNVYFSWDDEYRNVEWIRDMISDTSGAAPSDELCHEILSTQAASGGVGITFSWDSLELQRWCLYSLEIPAAEMHGPEVTLPPRLERFLDAPTLNLDPQFNVAWSFGGKQTYIKVEKSYARDATFFLTHEMGGDLSRPAAGSGHGR